MKENELIFCYSLSTKFGEIFILLTTKNIAMRTLLFFTFFVLFMSCKQETSQTTEPATEAAVTVSQDTISPQTFLEWTSAWDSLGKAFSDTSLVQYFEDPSKARFYNGLEDKGNGHYEAHLVLTAVGRDGMDIGQYFDITQPCPPICKPK